MYADAASALAAYQASRQDLITQDRALRADHQRSWSDKERRVDELIRGIRADEAKTIWSRDYANIPHPFPGMEFLTGQSIQTICPSVLRD
jgi:adenosine deaminase CECR1